MGVPAFYRWLSMRYPKCIFTCEEEVPEVIDGVEIPVDCTKPSPNGEVDNLYLDMNGIIHPCFHPEGKPAPLTFEQCFKDIFEYIDRIMAVVRPRKLLYMAIDGVAPRAKMNQQRARRFKSAKDAKDKMKEDLRIREELRSQGVKVKESGGPTEPTALSDSNIITPGTEFMAKLSVALQYYIHMRINSNPAWTPLMVVLSDANVPGEGEHKIMQYIRQQRGRPGWNPNMTHVVSGLDADLIHLALATHEPNFHILREVVFGPPAGDAEEGGAKPKVPYQYLKVAILREYLTLEFNNVRTPFEFDKERIFDDFVFLCFFVGNDFLPHSPTLEIREGGIDLLMTIYKRQLPFMGGYICDGAKVDLKRVEIIIRNVTRYEEQILRKRMRILRNQDNKRKSAVKRPMKVTIPFATVDSHGRDHSKDTPKKQKTFNDAETWGNQVAINSSDETGKAVNSEQIWNELLAVDSQTKAENLLPEASSDEAGDESEKIVQSILKETIHEKADMFDSMIEHGESVGFDTAGWKERYYRMKFPDVGDSERGRLIKDMTEKFVEGLLWVMAYYYEGVASWTWYYPYHYAPFASDLLDGLNIKPEFELGEPFLPVNQLMAVLPAASRFCLPKCLQHLFVDKDSPIVDFYPENFKCDMNGKRFSWQAVVLLPFIDEKRLIETTKEYFKDFTEEEKERNKRKLAQAYFGGKHPLWPVLAESVATKSDSLRLNPETSNGVNGLLCFSGNYCPDKITAPFGLGDDIENNKVAMASFVDPPQQQHRCRLMSGTRDEATGLDQFDIPPEAQMWHEHPRAGNNPVPVNQPPRPQFSIDKEAAHRFVVHSVSEPRFRDDAPERHVKPAMKSTLRATAPEFVPASVTQMALRMTGHMQPLAFVPQPPPFPPADVTDAAIRLNERARKAQQQQYIHQLFPNFEARPAFGFPQPPFFMERPPPGNYYPRDQDRFDNRRQDQSRKSQRKRKQQ